MSQHNNEGKIKDRKRAGGGFGHGSGGMMGGGEKPEILKVL